MSLQPHSSLHFHNRQPPPAQPTLDADVTYPNCYTEWQSGHFGKPEHGSMKALRLLGVASVALLLLAAVVAVMLASFAVGMGVIRLSTLGATAESAGILRSIQQVGCWG